MHQHEEATKWFARAKLLKNDVKNVVGDQPLSEQALSSFKFPAAAARRSMTLECIEEMTSPQTCDASDEHTPEVGCVSFLNFFASPESACLTFLCLTEAVIPRGVSRRSCALA